jgi:twitching motility protein PilI
MMPAQNELNPVAILREIEDCCRGCEVGLPRKADVSNNWAGIAFRLGSVNLLAQMDDVVEVLEFPEFSIVPLTQPWVRGIANIRGNLLPILDLNAYLGNEMPRVTNKTRVLVIDFNGVYSGLVVDEVLGLKNFMDEEMITGDAGVDEKFRPYINSTFRHGGQVWGVFSLQSLAESPLYMQAAV